MSNTNQLEILKLVNSKLEARRDELMDIINVSLSSSIANRIQFIYDAQIELATIEKALEINRFFQIQLQEQVLETVLENINKDNSNDKSKLENSQNDEELKK
jgi:hypothetical protein